MVSRDQRREAAIEAMADHLLAVGLNQASLRSLARAAGTSDRMLLYYFADKDEILAVTLTRLAGRITESLEGALPPGTLLPFEPLLAALWGAVGSDALRPFMRLWLDLATGAARGDEPHRAIGGGIIDGFLAWIAAHLDAPPAERPTQAARLLATVDGMMLLDAVGRRSIAEAAVGS